MVHLAVENITKHFDGVYALQGVSFVIEKGTITSIIGPNGSGKTTFTNIASGMYPWDEGVVALDGRRFSVFISHQVLRLGITRTFQDVRLFPQMTVNDNLLVVVTHRSLVRSLITRESKTNREHVHALLEKVGLLEKQFSRVETLSYGQRKLLEIARVLAIDPLLIFFDEPFAGLFPAMVSRVVSIMKDLRLRGVTQVLIEHNMELIQQLSDRVIVLDGGSVLAQGAPKEVLSQRDVIEAYLGE